MKRTAQRRTSGFTLVELLVVISIIAILAGILLPALRGAFSKADKAQAQAEVKSIESAIRAYYNEYSKLPAEDSWQGKDDEEYRDLNSRLIISRLGTNNPRRIIFLEVPGGSTDGTFKDPWGKQYAISLDNDYSGQIALKTTAGTGMGTNKVFAPGVACSGGPDGDIATQGDNIYSFK